MINNINSVEKFILKLFSTVALLTCVILAFYIHVFGKSTPGGGFQSGAILSTGLLIYQVFNQKIVLKNHHLTLITSFGVVLYILTGFASYLLGGNLFEYAKFHDEKGHIIGAFLVETGVLLVVSSSMIRISNALSLHN